MKLLFANLLFISCAFAHYRVSERCNNCDKKKDEMPAVMAQTFFNILINGFIATQNSGNKEQQNAAVVNALNSLSQFVQTFVKKQMVFDNQLNSEVLLQAFEDYLKNPD